MFCLSPVHSSVSVIYPSLPCTFLIMCNVPSVWYFCRQSTIHSLWCIMFSHFTVQVHTKLVYNAGLQCNAGVPKITVYSIGAHKSSFLYRCIQNQYTLHILSSLCFWLTQVAKLAALSNSFNLHLQILDLGSFWELFEVLVKLKTETCAISIPSLNVFKLIVKSLVL